MQGSYHENNSIKLMAHSNNIIKAEATFVIEYTFMSSFGVCDGESVCVKSIFAYLLIVFV